jgi:hypothetical protein
MKNFNEKCAEYLGAYWVNDDTEAFPDGYWMLSYEEDGETYESAYASKDMNFDSDWNWIMILLEAILDECYEEGDLEPYYIVTDAIPVLEDTKQAILNYFDNE